MGVPTGCSTAEVARVWDDALPGPLLQHAAAEVDHLFAPSRSGGHQRGARSLWIPVRAAGGMPPFALPRVVQRLVCLARSLIPDSVAIVGAEVWGQHRDGMPLHYDRDEVLFARSGGADQRHPIASTVTYLREAGAPTLILNQTAASAGRETSRTKKAGESGDAWLIWPRIGRHVWFRGDLLHGVIASLAPQASGELDPGERTTLLINWWAEELEPSAGHAVRLTSSWAEGAVSPRSGLRGLPALPADLMAREDDELLLAESCGGSSPPGAPTACARVAAGTSVTATGQCRSRALQIDMLQVNLTAQYAGAGASHACWLIYS